MKPFSLDKTLTDEPEASLPSVFGSMVLGRLLDSGGSGKDVELAVGQHTVDIEEEQFDFPGARFGRESLGHRRILALARPKTVESYVGRNIGHNRGSRSRREHF